MKYKKGQRFVDKNGKVIIQIVGLILRISCGDKNCTMCKKPVVCTIQCIQNKYKRKNDGSFLLGQITEIFSSEMKSWTYLEGQDAPKKNKLYEYKVGQDRA